MDPGYFVPSLERVIHKIDLREFDVIAVTIPDHVVEKHLELLCEGSFERFKKSVLRGYKQSLTNSSHLG